MQSTLFLKVTQYSCDYNNLAPPGCTQYFFGSTAGTVQTYNFQGGQHLANQDHSFCIRYELNKTLFFYLLRFFLFQEGAG